MPAKPRWFRDIPKIIEQLEKLRSPVLDRAAMEELFHVRRRRAIELLEQFGGYLVGSTFVVHRTSVIAALRQQLATDDVRWECSRRQRVAEMLEQVRTHQHARRVVIPARADVCTRSFDELPADVQFEAGRLIVGYAGAVDLLAELFGLAQAISNQYEVFEMMVSTGGGAPNTPTTGQG